MVFYVIFQLYNHTQEASWHTKKIEYGFSFADIAIKAYSDKNRNLLFFRDIENTIDWQSVQGLLMEYYEPGKSKAREKAYIPSNLGLDELNKAVIRTMEAHNINLRIG